MIDRNDQKLQVQQATDIVRLIGEHLSLRPKGKEFLGLCPFHEDKNPSMHVSPVKQIYKCFSCGAGGDVFSFVMNYHKMTFPEAMGYLAERSGIALKRRGRAETQSDSGSPKQALSEANQRALDFFQASLDDERIGSAAREYLKTRGVSREMIEAFQVGYAPDSWDTLSLHAANQRWDAAALLSAGLTSQRKNGNGYFDRFRHRLMFPIRDMLGRPVAFGGRVLPGSQISDETGDRTEAKYLNSPETALFSKSATLFGLDLGKKPIIDSRVAVVVEGYTDVIACHQAGHKNVVATLGTALTRQHASALGRLCEKVVLIFDADEAGRKAADRALEVFLAGEIDVCVGVLPGGVDPADLLNADGGSEQWKQIVDGATEALEYKLDRLRGDLEESDTMTGRQRVAERYLGDLARLGLERLGVIRRAMVTQRIGDMLGLTRQDVERLVRKLSVGPRAAVRVEPSSAHEERTDSSTYSAESEKHEHSELPGLAIEANEHRIKALHAAERCLIGCLLRDGDLFHHTLSDGRGLDEAVTPSELLSQEARDLYEIIYQRLSSGDNGLTLSGLLADLAAAGQENLARWAIDAEGDAEQRTGGGSASELVPLLDGALEQLLSWRAEHEYQQTRRGVVGAMSHDDPQQARMLKELAEHRRAHPSPVRIAKLGAT